MTTLHTAHALDQVRLVNPLLQFPPPQFCYHRNNIQYIPQAAEEDDVVPILLRPSQCSYHAMFKTLSSAPLRCLDDKSGGCQKKFPTEVVKHILSFLTVKRVKPDEVQVTNCSSHDGTHPLSLCLRDQESSWWLSHHGTMPGGRGQQWVQFRLSDKLRRLSSVSLKIPPTPQGPLSVCEFGLQAFHLERGWHAITPRFRVQNQAGWQTFSLVEEADVDEVRLVCYSNQVADLISEFREQNPNETNLLLKLRRFESVGFFSVKFA